MPMPVITDRELDEEAVYVPEPLHIIKYVWGSPVWISFLRFNHNKAAEKTEASIYHQVSIKTEMV